MSPFTKTSPSRRSVFAAEHPDIELRANNQIGELSVTSGFGGQAAAFIDHQEKTDLFLERDLIKIELASLSGELENCAAHQGKQRQDPHRS